MIKKKNFILQTIYTISKIISKAINNITII